MRLWFGASDAAIRPEPPNEVARLALGDKPQDTAMGTSGATAPQRRNVGSPIRDHANLRRVAAFEP